MKATIRLVGGLLEQNDECDLTERRWFRVECMKRQPGPLSAAGDEELPMAIAWR